MRVFSLSRGWRTDFFVGLLGVLLGISTLTASRGEASDTSWQTDYAVALAKAKERDLPLLLFFTQAQHCIWCEKLEQELCGHPAFQTSMGRDFVGLRVTIGARKGALPLKQERQNRRLQKQFVVTAFPEVLWVNGVDETVLTRHHYVQVEVEAYLQANLARAAR